MEGRIQAGLGRPEEALRLLAEARESFEAEGMFYDVALALLEEARRANFPRPGIAAPNPRRPSRDRI